MDMIVTTVLGLLALYLFGGLKVLREYERAVYFFLGRSWGAKGPGLIYVPPLFAKTQTVSLRVVAMDIPPQDVITRDNISNILKNIIDKRSENWGIEVTAVEVKDVDLPPEMKRAMARQAEAERERRAKVINAEGELQASEKLAQAARIIGAEPAAIQLRYLQTVTEISSENNSTTFFPIPIDLFKGFLDSVARKTTAPALPERASGETLSAAPKTNKVEA